MYAIATFLFVAVVSMLFTRLATGALIATGLPHEIARFQARSGYTGTGFTTTESENVVNHPVRRRVIYTVMLVGNLGTPTLVITVLLGFLAPGPGDTSERLLSLLGALVVVLLIMSSSPVTRWLEGVGRHYAQRRLFPALAGQAEELLDLGDGFVVSRIPLTDVPADTMRSLRALRRHMTAVEVLGIRRNQGNGTRYIGDSPTDIGLEDGDALVVHGRREAVTRLTEAAL